MASNTVTVSALGTVFDFTTTRRGTVSFFTNDLNISYSVTSQAPGALIRLHTGPILFAVSTQVGPGFRVVISAQSIGTGFPPPPLSLLQLQTDTVLQI